MKVILVFSVNWSYLNFVKQSEQRGVFGWGSVVQGLLGVFSHLSVVVPLSLGEVSELVGTAGARWRVKGSHQGPFLSLRLLP